MKLVAGQDLALSEAAEWSIRLAETPEDADLRRQFELWRATPENAGAWALIGRASAALDHLKVQPARKRAPWRGWGGAAGAIAAALAIGWIVLPGALTGLGADHVAGRTARVVALEDGTTVHLAPGTAIDVDYRVRGREVRLRDGEAMFEVRRDPARPFSVVGGASRTVVLGTGFDVRRTADGAEVAVAHGKVQVSLDGRSVVLTAGKRAVAHSGRLTSEHFGAELVGLWRQGKVVAVDRSLVDVVEDIDRDFEGRILLDPRLRERRVSGLYDATDAASATQAVAQAVDGRIISIGDRLIIVAAR